ncbi:MAG: nucleotidyltransferase family protein [Terriglobales bacterium]
MPGPPPTMPEAMILCGGRGSRLRGTLGETPKVLAEVGGRPFLEHWLGRLAQAGVARVILCTGVGGEAVEKFASERPAPPAVVYSRETVALGTGGALALARSELRGNTALVLNGDSWVTGLDLGGFFGAWNASGLPGGLVLTPADPRHDTGRVALGANLRIAAMAEKQALAGASSHSAGVYLLRCELLDDIETGRPVSLETELFPRWLARGLFGYAHAGELLDIGTPERLAGALRRWGAREHDRL